MPDNKSNVYTGRPQEINSSSRTLKMLTLINTRTLTHAHTHAHK